MGKGKKLIRSLLIDAAAAGLALTAFALFHHVLPREQQSLNVQTVQTAQTVQTTATAAQEEDARTETRAAQAAETQQLQTAAVRTAETPAADAQAADAQPTDAQTAATQKADGQTEPEADAEFRPEVRITASAGRSDTGSTGRSRPSSSRQRKQSGGNSGKNAMNSKGGSALTDSGNDDPEDAETAAAAESVPLAEKFADRFTDTVVTAENSYSSPDLSVTVTEVQEGSLTYYLADIYVRDITCFRTALAADTYGSGFRDSIEDMAALNSALLAVNGDYYGNTSEGVVIRNGVIYRANPTDCDVCVLYYDGTMKVMPGASFSVEEAVADGAWQAWTFGPALLDADGEALTAFASTNRIIAANPRTAIGYYEPGHYCLVVADGRGASTGITLPQLSALFHDLGCTAAYNLDGGNSSVMVWGNEVINHPSGGGRESSDALLLAEVRDYE